MNPNEQNVTWYMDEDLLLNVVAPLDYWPDPAVPVPLAGTIIAIGRIVDKRVKTVTTATAAISATTINIQEPGSLFAANEVILIEQFDGTFHNATVSDNSDNSLIFSPATAKAVGRGARVWKLYGPVGTAGAAGVLYGTPNAADDTGWGYVALINHDFLSEYYRRDLKLEAIFTIDESVSGAKYQRMWNVITAESRGAP